MNLWPRPWPLGRAARRLRLSIVGAWWWAASKNPQISWGEIRPIPVNAPPFALPRRTDCTGLITLICRWRGAPDPNGRAYDGAGYTGTMLAHLRHIPRWQARRGDIIVFGDYPGLHGVQLLQGGWRPDPLIGSHGWDGEPAIHRLSWEAGGFPRATVTYLRLVPADWKP